MKTTVLPLLTLLASLTSGQAQTTTFTYQGRLTENGAPANGHYDLQFTLRDAPAAGNQIGGVLVVAPVGVTNGLFAVPLDFGAAAFPGADRWLAIGVRTNGSAVAYTLLSPRQAVTAAPYALQAANATVAATAALVTGPVSDTQLSANIPRLSGSASFTGSVTATSFTGGGAGLTNVNAASLTGTLADARLSTNVALLNVPNTAMPATGTPIVTSGFITGASVTGGGSGYPTAPAVTVNDATGTGAMITATVSGGAVTGLAIQNAGTGYSGGATLTIAPPPSNAYQVFSGTNIFTGVNTFSSANGGFMGSFAGNGAGVTNVNAALLAGMTPANFWQLGGNSGSDPRTDFLGTRDNQALEFKVNNLRALRLEPTANDANHSNLVNVVGGSPANFVGPGVYGATIAGGGAASYFAGSRSNSVFADLSTIGGGGGNTIQARAYYATLGGGAYNTIQINAYYATLGGGYGNTIQSNASLATIGGGVQNTIQENAYYATLGGGYGNTIQTNAPYSTLGGGAGNTIQTAATHATLGGGANNTIQPAATLSTLGGGANNTIQTNASYSTLGGGYGNTATGLFAVLPGGDLNVAGTHSLAAGHRAKATHSGAFVWADATEADFATTSNNQFLIRASGGVGIGTNAPGGALGIAVAPGQTLQFRVDGGVAPGINVATSGNAAGVMRLRNVLEVWPSDDAARAGKVDVRGTSGTATITLDGANGRVTCVTLNQTSDRHAKENFQPVSAREVLEKVAALPISRWNYKQDAATPHLGPTAQDFFAAFGVGTDDQHIATVDEGGVALAAIQGLHQLVQEKDSEITTLKQRLADLEKMVRALVPPAR